MDVTPFGRSNAADATGVTPPHIAALRDSLPLMRTRIFWSFQVAFWSAILVTALGLSNGMLPAETTVLTSVLRAGTGFVISTLVYLLFEMPRLCELPRRVRWPLIVVLTTSGLVASLLLMIMAGLLGETSNWPRDAMLWVLAPRTIMAGFWCAGIFGLEVVQELYRTKLRLAETEATAIYTELRLLKAESVAQTFELRQLQAQMNPHFLFNALNAVANSKDDPETVESVTRDLADYLRFTLGEARTLEPLSRELRALEKYLAIQHARFGDNLVCRFSCDRAAHAAIVPPMLIQPILENALHYGAQTSSMPLRVSVTAKVVDGWLEVVVANTGRWVAPDTTRSPSTGIRSLRKRLALLIDEAATVDTVIDPDLDGGWVRVVIRMPARFTQPAPTAHEPTPATELA
jgi:sensor histidine kinase YesM